MQKKSSGIQWILNQLLIFVFGLLFSFHGYRIFADRKFVSYHYRITVDFGDNHNIYGLILMGIGIALAVFAAIGFIYRGKRRLH
jgi:hypothetical protein